MPPRNLRPVARHAKATEAAYAASSQRLALFLLLAHLGCTATPPALAPVRRHWVPGYVFGIWGKTELDIRDDCPSPGAARVRIGATWSTLLVSVVTLGMYAPHEVIVHCRVAP